MRRLAALLAALWVLAASAADPLPALGADPQNVSVSGVSSGGYMAVQFHMAHSSVVNGVGVLAAGPYYCAQGSVWTALSNCMSPGRWTPLPGIDMLKAQADTFAAGGQIDPTYHLLTANVWLFSGTNDRTVAGETVQGLARFYREYVRWPERLRVVDDKPAGHAMVTESVGGACPVTQPPFINDCDYDAAGALLEFLLGALERPAEKQTGRTVIFDQRPFADGDAYSIGMADSGYLYVPRACDAGGCRVHVAFHGCRQNVAAIGERFVREAGYNRWADTNRLVVLYPQTVARNGWGVSGWHMSFVVNPRACWDWWGYTGESYATKAGPQVRAIKAMVDRLAAPRPR